MSSLSKQFMLLFATVAIIIVLMVSVVMNLDWITIIKRILIGAMMFSVIGAILGELINFNLNYNKTDQVNKSLGEIASNQEGDFEGMVPLDFQTIDKMDTDIINGDPEKLAKIIKNMKQE